MHHTFEETVLYLGDRLGSAPDKEALQKGSISLFVDHLPLSFTEKKGEVEMKACLGYLLFPLSGEEQLELLYAQFLGVGTQGCTFSLERNRLYLKTSLSLSSSPSESFEWFHRLLNAAHHWEKRLQTWKSLSLFIGDKP